MEKGWEWGEGEGGGGLERRVSSGLSIRSLRKPRRQREREHNNNNNNIDKNGCARAL